MKTKLFALASSVLLSCVAGCSTESTASAPGVPLEPNERAASNADVTRVISPVAASKLEDYVAAEDTFRVMGIEHGDDQVGTYAVVSNTKTWSTRHVLVGDLLGRNHKVMKIADGVVELEGRGGKTSLAVGKDVRVTRVLHKYDRVVRYEGRNVFTFSPRIAAELGQKGVGIQGEDVMLEAEAGVKLVSVDANLEASALGFKAGDIVFSIDGVAATAGTLDGLFGKFSTGSDVGVRMLRDGSVRTVRYHAP